MKQLCFDDVLSRSRRAPRRSEGRKPTVRTPPTQAIRTARALAMAGMPRRPTQARSFQRDLRLGSRLWVRIGHLQADPEKLLPFGQDRFVLVGIQHLALEGGSPLVVFDHAQDLLTLFGLPADGRNLSRLRDALDRLAGLVIQLRVAPTRQELSSNTQASYRLLIEDYSLPTRSELRARTSTSVNVLPFPPAYAPPHTIRLGDRFWAYLQEPGNRFLVPFDLLRRFLARPLGWDYLCFLVARCGSARSHTVVPHEALMELFRASPAERERRVIERLRSYHREIQAVTGGRLRARIVEATPLYRTGGRPRKRWQLRVGPSEPLSLARDTRALRL